MENFVDFQSKNHTGQSEKDTDCIRGYSNQGREPDRSLNSAQLKRRLHGSSQLKPTLGAVAPDVPPHPRSGSLPGDITKSTDWSMMEKDGSIKGHVLALSGATLQVGHTSSASLESTTALWLFFFLFFFFANVFQFNFSVCSYFFFSFSMNKLLIHKSQT